MNTTSDVVSYVCYGSDDDACSFTVPQTINGPIWYHIFINEGLFQRAVLLFLSFEPDTFSHQWVTTLYITGWKSSLRVTVSVMIKTFAALWGINRVKPCPKMNSTRPHSDLQINVTVFFILTLSYSTYIWTQYSQPSQPFSLKKSDKNGASSLCMISPLGHTPGGCPGCHCGGQTWALCHL